MKVLIVNTSERVGGAAVAANRLLKALNKNGIAAKMLVNNKNTDDSDVLEIPGKWRKKIKFVFERFLIFLLNGFSKKNLFDIDPAFTGTNITRLDCFKEADVIHLHWINQGMLSLKNLRQILQSGKPVVWTMHDQWASTGICHSTGDCIAFRNSCGSCPLLTHSGERDLSKRIFLHKQELNQQYSVLYITCSKWLKSQSEDSGVIRMQQIKSIPNPIDINLFKPVSKTESRSALHLPLDKKLILIGAVKLTDWRKGFDYMLRAFYRLDGMYSSLKNQLEIVAIGNGVNSIQKDIPFTVNGFSYVSSEKELARIYNAVDFFFTPSLFENLPNMIMEAMACGVPCMGFEVGGIPEMIDHKENGYVARYRDVEDLISGFSYLLNLSDNNYAVMSRQCREKVENFYSEDRVANLYKVVYEDAMSERVIRNNG